MPKSHRKKTRRGGGMWDDFKNKASGLTSGTSSWSPSSWTSGTSSWNPFAKKETTASTYTPPASSTDAPSPPTPSYTEPSPPTPTTQTMGGKRRRVKRGGSYSANMSQTNLAATASPVSGIQTVKAQTWVGGKTKKRRHRRHKHKKSCRHR